MYFCLFRCEFIDLVGSTSPASRYRVTEAIVGTMYEKN